MDYYKSTIAFFFVIILPLLLLDLLVSIKSYERAASLPHKHNPSRPIRPLCLSSLFNPKIPHLIFGLTFITLTKSIRLAQCQG